MIAPWLQSSWSQLQSRCRENRLPHALLFAAPKGLGKREFAFALAAALLCDSPSTSAFACGHCRACVLRQAGTHPDHHHVSYGLRDDGKLRSEIVVDQIRELCEQFARTSARGGWRIGIIDPADMLNRNAANALLKTLEEPEANVVIMLVADDPARLPATIRSRCQQVELPMPATEDALAWLVAQGIESAHAAEVLILADGNPGEALQLASPENWKVVKTIIDDIESVVSGQPIAPIATRWSDENAGLRLRSLARLITAALRANLVGKSSVYISRMQQLIKTADFLRLSNCWDKINWSRSQLGTALRSDILIADVLVSLRAAL